MLTISQVKAAKAAAKDYKLTDGAGLYLLITAAGGKYWRCNYVDASTGKQKTCSYGVYPKISLAQARAAHVAFKDGQQSDESKTLGYWLNEFNVKRNANVSDGHRHKFDSIIKNHISQALKDKPIGSFTRRDWVDLVTEVADKGVTYTSHQLAQYLNRVNDYAIDMGDIETHKAGGLTRILPKQNEVVHRPALTDDSEHHVFFERLFDANCDERVRLGTLLLALTLTRTSETRFAKWSEFDFATRIWEIKGVRMKSARDHLVPLTDEIIEVIEALRAINGDCDYILASPRNPQKPISENAIIYNIYRMGYHSRMTGHGFRAMGSTWLNERQFYSPAIEIQLAHVKKDKTKAAYDRAEHWDERVKIMNAWSKYIMPLFQSGG